MLCDVLLCDVLLCDVMLCDDSSLFILNLSLITYHLSLITNHFPRPLSSSVHQDQQDVDVAGRYAGYAARLSESFGVYDGELLSTLG